MDQIQSKQTEQTEKNCPRRRKCVVSTWCTNHMVHYYINRRRRRMSDGTVKHHFGVFFCQSRYPGLMTTMMMIVVRTVYRRIMMMIQISIILQSIVMDDFGQKIQLITEFNGSIIDGQKNKNIDR